MSDVHSLVTKDGGFLLDADSEACFSLNPVGARTWQLLQKGYNVPEIVEELGKIFPSVPQDILNRDVKAFLVELRQKNLLSNSLT